MESKIDGKISGGKTPIILKFGNSDLLTNFKRSNDVQTHAMRRNGDLKGVFESRLNSEPPNSDILKIEGSGNARVEVFLNQTEAEFVSKTLYPGDENILQCLRSNIQRVGSDYFWACFILRHLIIKVF